MDDHMFQHPDRRAEGEKPNWIDHPGNVRRIFWALAVVSAALLSVDLFLHKHDKFGFESLFGFFAFYGFALPFLLVLAAKQLRKIVMRDEDYYDR